VITINQLLNRIRWDREFGRGDFVVGYYDRVQRRIITVPLRELSIDPADHFAFDVLDDNGELHHVPFHRVRRVFKGGKLIWHRKDEPRFDGTAPDAGAATDVHGQCRQASAETREPGPLLGPESSNRKRGVKPAKFSAGMVVLRSFAGTWRCLMLRAFRNWDFPKGEVEAGESPLAAARREVQDETSLTALDLRWGGDFCETEPYRGGKIARYYLAESPHGEVTLPFSPELGRPEHHEYRWVDFSEAKNLAPARLQPIIAWAESFSAGRPPPTACDAHGK